MSGNPDRVERLVMELINLEVSKYGVSLQTYFGDIYLYHRTWLLVAGVVIVLRTAKFIRKAGKK